MVHPFLRAALESPAQEEVCKAISAAQGWGEGQQRPGSI